MLTRDEAIACRVLAGETLGQVAADVGLTRQRVSQIVKAHDPQFDGAARYKRKVKAAAEQRAAEQDDGLTDEERHALERRRIRAIKREPVYSDEAIIAALRAYYDERGIVPTTQAWHDEGLSPTVPRILTRFNGSWNGAIEAAGMTPHKRRVVYQQFSDEDVLRAIAEFLYLPGASDRGGLHSYGKWAKGRGLPSASLARTRFGTWTEAKTRAIAFHEGQAER